MYINYSWYQIAWFFLLYSFMGWCIEVAFTLLTKRRMENRGFFNGPVCIVYGLGATTVVLLARYGMDLFTLFLVGVLITTSWEFIVGATQHRVFSKRCWDYSHNLYNYHGYICLKYSILWGCGCLALVHFIHPYILRLVNAFPKMAATFVVLALYMILVLDVAFSCVNALIAKRRQNKKTHRHSLQM